MPVNFGQVPDEQTVVWAMQQGEGQQIEFKGTIPDPRTIGRNISAFADTAGGLILIGIREHPTSIVGCDFQRLTQVFDRTIEKLRPADAATLHRVVIDGKDVGVISIPPSAQVVTSEDGIFTRVGAETQKITVPQAQAKIPQTPPPVSEQLAEGLVLLTNTVETLRAELGASRSFKGQLPGLVLSFVMGFITGVIGNYIFKALGN